MYGSSFCIVTRRPRPFSRRPRDDAVMPLPRELATPPVTKMCFVTGEQANPRAVLSPGMAEPRQALQGLRRRRIERPTPEAVHEPQRRHPIDHLRERHLLAREVED